jgi:two-component system NtrC family sensor kinase
MIMLAEAYFYRYVQVIQEKTRELALCEEMHARSIMRAEKLAGLGQLAAGVAHEINNPLATIAITVSDLLESLETEQSAVARAWRDLPRGLSRVRAEVARCKGITGSLVELARVRAPTVEGVDVCDLLGKVAHVARCQARDQGKTVTTDLCSGDGAIRSDPGLIEQAVLNLISNALDATPAGGSVELRAGCRPDGVDIAVEDHGEGIAPEHMDRIFEPFFTTKPPGKGTGLGLAVAYAIVRKLGGQLTIDSAPRKGTVAKIRLPLAHEEEP